MFELEKFEIENQFCNSSIQVNKNLKRSFVKMFSLKAIIAPREYHVYKETAWSNAKMNEKVKVELETDAKSLSTNPYACAIKAKHSFFIGWKTVGHIPREISRYVHFL